MMQINVAPMPFGSIPAPRTPDAGPDHPTPGLCVVSHVIPWRRSRAIPRRTIPVCPDYSASDSELHGSDQRRRRSCGALDDSPVDQTGESSMGFRVIRRAGQNGDVTGRRFHWAIALCGPSRYLTNGTSNRVVTLNPAPRARGCDAARR